MNLTLLTFLSIAVVTDVMSARISNRLILSGLFFGFVLRFLGQDSTGILIFLINISIPVILLYLLFQLHALGAGDIKLFSVIGAYVSTKELLEIMVVSFFAGAVIGAGKIIYERFILGKASGKLTKIHFSIPILIAYLLIGQEVCTCLK